MIQTDARKILIVDGCSMTRECITVLLRAQRFAVISSPTLENALELIRLHRPAVVIHELDLPDGTGEDLIERARTMMGSGAPSFFLLTTCARKSRLLGVIERGVTQVLIKHQFTIKVFYSKVTMLQRDRKMAAGTEQPPAGAACGNEPARGDAATGDEARVPEPAAATNRPWAPPRTKEQKLEIYKSVKPVVTKSEAIERTESMAEIKALSPTAARVISLTGSAEASLDTVAKAIRNDHAIALKVIRIANSTAFSRGEPVSTLNDAVRRIGVQQIRQTVLNLEIMENFSADTSQYIDHRLFWEHSIAVATCCSLISRQTRQIDADEAFTIGLLHDVGRMIMYQAFGDDYIGALRFARENLFPLEQIERRLFQIDHSSIMQTVLHKWGIHKDLIDPIVNHHLSVGNIRQTCPKRIEAVSTVALANRIVHALGIGCSGNETVYPTEEFFEAMKLPRGFMSTIEEILPEMVLDMRLAMLGEMGINNYPQPRRSCRNMGLNPLYATLDPEIDCIGHWVGTLRDDFEATFPPNLIMARMRKQRDAASIDAEIGRLEEERGVEGLPVIVLSNGGNLTLPESVRVSRETRLLAAPFTLDEFEQVVRSIPSLGNDKAIAGGSGDAASLQAA